MKQMQRSIIPVQIQRDLIQGDVSHRLLGAGMLGAGVMVFLTLLEVLVLVLFNPFHVLGGAGSFAALFVLPVHAPLSLLVPLGELVVSAGIVLVSARPMAEVFYLRDVHRAQEEYYKFYTPLAALVNLRKAADEDGSSSTSLQEQQVSILDLVRQQDIHQLILGAPGAGKTTVLRVYQYLASLRPIALVLRRGRIPVYVPMKNYSLFLKKQLAGMSDEEGLSTPPSASIFEYLYVSDLPGMRHLSPCVQQLAQEGRLLLLCDGLNELDRNYLARVNEEIAHLMLTTRNRFVMTCREVDYREQEDFVQLVEQGQAARVVIYPLRHEQMFEFVERYIERQDKQWKHTAGQIMQVIDRSRLRYHCTNPMMLFALMGVIDKIGIERGKQIDTRGRLLRAYVSQLIADEQRQARWSEGAPGEQEVVRFLSELACAARWANDRDALQLRVSSVSTGTSASESDPAHSNFVERADELQLWLDEHPARGPFSSEETQSADVHDDVPLLLQFALSSALIELSPSGVLSFRHELIADYLVAEYFFAATESKQPEALPIRGELLEHVGYWSEPVAMWAGLLDNPLVLAERFGAPGLSSPASVLQALALGLVCVGVSWTPPQAEVQRTVMLPPSLEESLLVAMRDPAAREGLARFFTQCAEEGGQEVYHSLVPLIMVDGTDELLILLDQTIVPNLLFTHLQDVVDTVTYEAQVKRLVRVLGRFGGAVVDQATELALPAAERSLRLRAAAINVLGGTNDPHAVEPLLARLWDSEVLIVERAINALIRLGPALTLTGVLQELEQRSSNPFTPRVHFAAVSILGRYMDEQDVRRQVSLMQYQRILEVLVPVLTSDYEDEPEAQKPALELLIDQARRVTNDNRAGKVVEALLRYLSSQNDVAVRNVLYALQEIGAPATAGLLEMLRHPSETVRVRTITVLQAVRDLSALPALLELLDDPAATVQQHVAQALRVYAPESIDGLIGVVLNNTSDAIADRAAQILVSISATAVEPVLRILPTIVAGRTRLLVEILARIRDSRALPGLIALLQTPQLDPLLAVTVIRALGQFQDRRAVTPLLSILSSTNPLLYEESINALSQLGEVALPGLVAALDGEQETLVTQRVRRAVLGILPFPGEQLIRALEQSREARAEQILNILKVQGPDGAAILVKYMLHRDEQIRDDIQRTLSEMPGPVVVPALIEVLDQPALRTIAGTFLLKYPDAAISPLVDLLSEHERGPIAASILPQFGPVILGPLLVGLDDQRSVVREMAQRILISLVRQSEDAHHILYEVVHLFSPSPPPRAREVLINLLTNELADMSLPALLEGLEDAYLIDDVAETLARLSRRASMQEVVLTELVRALYLDERRRGAETALIKIGAPAVARIGEMITERNQPVAHSAWQILREIGVPALSFIWTAQSDKTNAARREAAMEIFRTMRSEVIKDELVALLVSNRREDTAMAVSLLLERIRDESAREYADQVMVPELLEYIQTHDVERTNLRVLALLLMLDEDAVADHLIQALEEYPNHRPQLSYALLLLGSRTHELLAEVFRDAETSPALRAEAATILGMVGTTDVVVDQVRNISKYGISSNRPGVLFPDQLAVALRALGGLLAGGHWNVRRLQELRDMSKDDDPMRDLASVLLGWLYGPQLARLQADLENQRETFKKELLTVTTRVVAEQQRAQGLEAELEKIREEHGARGDELQRTSRERDTLRAHLDQVTKDQSSLRATIEQLTKDKNAINTQLERAKLDYQILLKQYQQRIQQVPNANTVNTQDR